MSAASSLCRRLRGLFNHSSTTPLPQPTHKPLPPPTLKSILDTQDLSQLVEQFKLLSKSKSFRKNQGIYARTVGRLASAGNHSAIDDILQFQKKFDNIRDERFVIRLISLYGSSGMLSHAHKLFDEMPILSCPRSVKSFNSLLKAAVKVGNQQECERIFEEVPLNTSVEPDVISYNILIHSLCEEGYIDKAVSMVEKMKSKGIQPSLVTFNTLLDEFYEGGRFSDAEKMWAAMEEQGLEAETRTYNGRIRGLMLHGRVEEAVVVMEEIGLKADSFTYVHMIKGFCGRGYVGEAEKWCEKLMGRKDLVPLKSSIEVIMSLAQRVGNVGLLKKLFEHVIQQRYWVRKEVLKEGLRCVLEKFGDEEHMKIVTRLKAVGCGVDCDSD